MTHEEAIALKKRLWVGRKVIYEGRARIVVDVDDRGRLLIDRPDREGGTTAIEARDVEKIYPRREPLRDVRLAIAIITLAICVAVLIRTYAGG